MAKYYSDLKQILAYENMQKQYILFEDKYRDAIYFIAYGNIETSITELNYIKLNKKNKYSISYPFTQKQATCHFKKMIKKSSRIEISNKENINNKETNLQLNLFK